MSIIRKFPISIVSRTKLPGHMRPTDRVFETSAIQYLMSSRCLQDCLSNFAAYQWT